MCCCAPDDSGTKIGVGDVDSDDFLEVKGVIVDCTGPVVLSNSRDVSAMSAWLSAAAVWLRVQELEQEGGNDVRSAV